MLDTAPNAGKKKPGMTEEAIVTLLEEMNRRSVGYLSDEVSADQDDNLERYLGRPYGDEEEGLSNAISMDVAEVVDWALPDLLEPFISGDKVVEFEPSTKADDAYCKQATDLAAHVFWRENNGFMLLHDTVKTACIQKIGTIKTVWRDSEKQTEETLSGLSLLQIQQLHQDASISDVQLTAEPAPPEAASAFPDGIVYTVQFTRTDKTGCI